MGCLRKMAAAMAAVGLVVGLGLAGSSPAEAVVPPPVNGQFDYQIGGAYRPGAAVAIVDRDRLDAPVAGKYNICYVNGFQTQSDQTRWWKQHHRGLLLHKSGRLVTDDGWGEVLLDTSSRTSRRGLARIVNRWVNGCARAGFQAVEFDNLDSYLRSRGRLSMADNLKYAKLLVSHAHQRNLAVAQKNTVELGGRGRSVAGFDFAIAEECQRYLECDAYRAVYGNHLVEIEYTDYSSSVFAAACRQRGAQISILRRDRFVTPADNAHYYYRSC